MARILVVDDVEFVRFVIRKNLESAGHEVTEAENGVEAIAAQDADPFDLIITDIVMPKKDGFETIKELHRRYPETKIIAISGGDRPSGPGMLTDAKTLGAQGVLSKPFGKQQLLQLIDEILQIP